MNTVQPIKSKSLVMEIAHYLKKNNDRDYVMFMFGLHSGLRVSDILRIKVGDVRGKERYFLREKKTGKESYILLHKDLQKAIKDYTAEREDWEYLFASRQRTSKKSKIKESRPITRQRAYQILKHAASAFGLERVGTHTMRKTFGYHVYNETKDIATLQMIFNHSSERITLLYIGVDQDRKESLISNFSFTK